METRPLTFAERMALAKKSVEVPAPTVVVEAEAVTATEVVSVSAPEPEVDISKLSFAEKMKYLKEQASKSSVSNQVLTDSIVPTPSTPSTPSTTQPTATIKEEEPKPALVEEGPLPNVILLANEANRLSEKTATEGELLNSEMPDSVRILKRRISELQNIPECNLRKEMDDLRTMLKANPDACMYFLPEDTGLLVRALRKITDNKVAADMGTTRTAKKNSDKVSSKPLSAEEMKAALEDL